MIFIPILHYSPF